MFWSDGRPMAYDRRVIPRLTELAPATTQTRAYLAALRRAGFRGDLGDDLATRVVGSTDNSIYQILPQAIVYPRSADDVVTVFRAASEAGFDGLAWTARGGGTGTNGQSLTSSIVVDVGRHLHHIGALDLAAGTVEVEPGVVLDQLNAHLEPHGVFFAPNLSPSSRATVGGMISTDASGQGSRVYGKTSQHVLAVEVVLVDGTRFWTEALGGAALQAMVQREDPVGRVHREVLGVARASHARFVAELPALHRFVTGYDLAHTWDPATETLDLKWLVCGAEGTLGIVTRARLRLTSIPTARRLAVLEFPSFDAALAGAQTLVALDPSSIETVDERVLDLARGDVIFDAVGAYLPLRTPPTRAIDLVEFEGDRADVVDTKLASLLAQCEAHRGEPGWPTTWSVAASEADRKALWQLRAKGVGLLGNTPGRRKPVPFVEDTVVPPERLAAYVAEFRALLEAEGLTYGMFGHVDVGCLHVRPALDLRDPEDEARIRRISDAVAKLCTKYGGVIWGEHGKGFRSEYSPLHFGPLFEVVCQLKAIFDPAGRLNPGKIATPTGKGLATIDQPLRGHHDRQIDRADQDAFALTIDCNGNAQCFSWDPDSVMCPSGKVTRDRIHTPKGRAGVMREWLRQLSGRGFRATKDRRYPSGLAVAATWPARAWNGLLRRFGRYDYSHDVQRAMAGCLACKACATQCPVKVDVPAFRSEFLQLYHTRYPRPLKDHLVGGLEGGLAAMSRLPRFFNFFLRRRWFQRVFGRLVGLVDSPPLAERSLKKRLEDRGFALLEPAQIATPKPATVYILQDAFTTFYEPEIVLATRDLLARLGFAPEIVPYFPNGKGLHVKGFLGRFQRLATKNAARLRALAASGAPIIGIDPAVVLTYRDEYPHALGVSPKELGFRVELLQEFLVTRIKTLGALARPSAPAGPPGPAGVGPKPHYTLFGHCTEKTLAAASQRQWIQVFAALGLDLTLKNVGCCGMSGAFGHEREHVDDSRGIFAMSWEKWLPPAGDPARERVLATGYSCRSQCERFASFVPRHPAEVLVAHLAERDPPQG